MIFFCLLLADFHAAAWVKIEVEYLRMRQKSATQRQDGDHFPAPARRSVASVFGGVGLNLGGFKVLKVWV